MKESAVNEAGLLVLSDNHTVNSMTHTHTTILRLSVFCPGQPG